MALEICIFFTWASLEAGVGGEGGQRKSQLWLSGLLLNCSHYIVLVSETEIRHKRRGGVRRGRGFIRRVN